MMNKRINEVMPDYQDGDYHYFPIISRVGIGHRKLLWRVELMSREDGKEFCIEREEGEELEKVLLKFVDTLDKRSYIKYKLTDSDDE